MWICLFVLFFTSFEVHGSNNIQLILPSLVAVGSSATLICQYDLHGAPLYSVKWYRGSFEFYRYVPGDKPPGRSFPFHGIYVDLSTSTDKQVSLLSVQLHLAGKFSCEVSAEGSFKTMSASDYLWVVDLRNFVPVLTVEEIWLNNTHLLHTDCTIPSTKPPSVLSFYINNVKVPREYVRTWRGGATVIINLSLQEWKQPSEELILKCVASVLATHHISSNTINICHHFVPANSGARKCELCAVGLLIIYRLLLCNMETKCSKTVLE